MIDFIKCVLNAIGILIGTFILFILIIMFTILPFSNNCYKGERIFEYEDMDGNTGIAHNCQYSDAKDNYKKGGQGQPICFVGKKVIVVKWYEDKTKYENCLFTI